MYRHQRYAVFVLLLILFIVHIGQKHQRLQPLLDSGALKILAFAIANLRLNLLVEHLHRIDNLLQVAHRRLRLGGILQAVEWQQSTSYRHLHTEIVQPLMFALQRQRANQSDKLGNLLHDCLLHRVGRCSLDHSIYSLPHRHLLLLRNRLDTSHRCIADTSCRSVDNTLECLIIARVYDKADIREHILDLFVVVEGTTFVYLIRNALLA